MKQLLPLLLLISGFANAQVVNIPDPIFKNALVNYTFHTIDLDNDGEIQFSEAEAYNLDLNIGNLGINDLTGIEAFTNLQSLYCEGNNLTTLNLGTLPNLQLLWCYDNNLTDLDLTGCTSLLSFTCSNNPITTLNIAGLTQLESIWCENINITSMDLSTIPTVTSAVVNDCSQLTSFRANNMMNFVQININNCPLLTELSLIGSTIESAFSTMENLPRLQTLNLSGSNNITNLFFFENPNLTSVDLSNCASLTNLVIGTTRDVATLDISGSNQFTYLSINGFNFPSIDLSLLTNLTDLYIGGNGSLTNIDLSANISLMSVLLQSNNLNSVVFPSTPTLTMVDVSGNQLQSIDLSAYPNMDYVYLSNNPLMTVNLKNGRNELVIECANLLALQHVCVDDTQISEVQALVSPSVEVNTYCDFTPGGNYNTITGTVRFDSNNNGCDSGDTIIPHFLRVNVSDVSNTGSNFINANGGYTFYTGIGNFTITPSFEYPAYFNFIPATGSAIFAALDNSVATVNFCMTANGTHPDLEVTLSGNPPRPGFNTRYQLVYRNNGNTVLSGSVAATFDDARMDFVSAIPAVDAQATGTLTWNFSNLQPFETQSIEFYLHVNSPTDTPAVNSGDAFALIASATIPNEETPADNTFTLNQIALNSYDPNNKTALEGDTVAESQIGKYLHYNINFENIGDDTATNVVVKDTINTGMFDISTLQVIHASHDVEVSIRGNIVEFVFKNINLPSAISNPIGGHGNVLFKIKTLPTLYEGDVVTNTANIYFDYNHPIETNEARTTFSTLKRQEFVTDNSVVVYPNPAKNNIAVQAKNNIHSIALFDIQGRILQVIPANSNKAIVDISDKTNGIYFIKVTTADGVKVEKIIKE